MGKSNDAPPQRLGWFTGVSIFTGLLLWVAICGAAFWFIFNGQIARSPDSAIQTLQSVMWPLTVVTVAMPLLLFLIFGGLDAIRQLVNLQSMVASFPDDIARMQEAVRVFKSIKEDMSTMRGQIVTDITLANAEDDAATSESAQQQQNGDTPDYITTFMAMYERAKQRFRSALQKYNSDPDRAAEPITIGRGESWAVPAAKLRDLRGNYYDPGKHKDKWVGDWVVAVLQTERDTRHNRANLLSADTVRRLADEERDG